VSPDRPDGKIPGTADGQDTDSQGPEGHRPMLDYLRYVYLPAVWDEWSVWVRDLLGSW